MVCRNIYLRLYSKMVLGQSHYSVGKNVDDANAIFVTPHLRVPRMLWKNIQ
jgi:hypothetical protein